MALIVETGTVVSGANSYVSLADAQAIIDARGYEVTLTEGLLLRAMDVLDGVRFSGEKTSSTNPLAWPRAGVFDSEGFEIPISSVPNDVVKAQSWIAYYISQGNDPSAVSTPEIVSETADVIKTEYAVSVGMTTAVSILSLPNVRNALSGLIAGRGLIDRA